MSEELRLLASKTAWSYYGLPYIWGGDDPSGLDCSGFCIEVLKSVGILPHGYDATANGLMIKFADKEVPKFRPQIGCLNFWLRKTDHKAIHVEMVAAVIKDEMYTIGFSGGNRTTTTPEAAAKSNAYCKVRPIKYRRGATVLVDPFKEGD